MSTHLIEIALVCAQGVAALGVLAGGVILLFTAVDGYSPLRHRWPLMGMCLWAVWMLWGCAASRHDSPGAVAMTALVAFVVLRHGRQVRGILDGETWWPPNARGAGIELSCFLRPRRDRLPWWRKLNPWWALFGNDDDGYFGDESWRAGRVQTFALAWAWWVRNPCHNLTWYLIGVADRERMHRGRWAPDIHKPGGGWLLSVTDVVILRVRLKLPFVSYISPYVKLYAGWRPSGAFGLKLNTNVRGEIPIEE